MTAFLIIFGILVTFGLGVAVIIIKKRKGQKLDQDDVNFLESFVDSLFQAAAGDKDQVLDNVRGKYLRGSYTKGNKKNLKYILKVIEDSPKNPFKNTDFDEFLE
jgi:hypothetical protein